MATAQRDIDLPSGYGLAPAEYPKDGAPAKSHAQYVGALFDEGYEIQRPRRRAWVQNLMFMAGRHWWEPLPNGDRWVPPSLPDWKEQPVTNITLAYYRTLLAKLTKNRPAWVVMPATMEPDDLHSAELGDDVLQTKWLELQMSRVLRRAISWKIATGNGFLLPYWNTRSGRIRRAEEEMEVPVYEEIDGEKRQVGTEVVMVPLDSSGEPILGEDGRPKPGADAYVFDEGEVGVMSPSPFQVIVNPEATCEEDVRWIIVAEVVSLREMAIRHPDLVNEIKPRDVEDLESYDRLMSGVMASGERGMALSTRGKDNLQKALVLHYYEKPNLDYPDGRYWQTTHDTRLTTPTGLPDGLWPPLIHLTDVDTPGSYWASSVMEQIVPLNRAYNRINAQILEHHNLMARGKWLNPKPSGIRKGMITNQPGEVLTYNPGFAPHQADIKPLPASVYAERDRIMADYELVSGIHRVSMGRPPPGVTAGVAFLQLQEADDTDIGPLLAMLEESVAQLAGHVLKVIRANYHEERLLYVVGKDRRFLVRAFRGTDLDGVGDVRPQMGSAFPWSKTAQQSMMLTLAAQMPQLFTDPETGMFDVARFARQLPMGGLETVGQADDLDVNEAQREEEVYANLQPGEMPPPVGWWQRHDVHFNQHVRVLKSAAFQEWPEYARVAFEQHVQETMAQRDQKAQQAAQMNAMAQGNAPKELYQQGGIMPEPGQMPEEYMGDMMETEGEPWVNEQMRDMDPMPAEGRPFEGGVMGMEDEAPLIEGM